MPTPTPTPHAGKPGSFEGSNPYVSFMVTASGAIDQFEIRPGSGDATGKVCIVTYDLTYTAAFSEDGTVATGTYTVPKCDVGNGLIYTFTPPKTGSWQAKWLEGLSGLSGN
jgi:hypothetical protein